MMRDLILDLHELNATSARPRNSDLEPGHSQNCHKLSTGTKFPTDFDAQPTSFKLMLTDAEHGGVHRLSAY
jgi:hypothetical protein